MVIQNEKIPGLSKKDLEELIQQKAYFRVCESSNQVYRFTGEETVELAVGGEAIKSPNGKWEIIGENLPAGIRISDKFINIRKIDEIWTD